MAAAGAAGGRPPASRDDAYGTLLRETWDLLRRDPAAPGPPEEVERDDGAVRHTPARRYFETPAESAELRTALGLVSGRVLDVGAGAGRCAVPLAARGSDVTALDLSPGAAAVCRDRGVRSVLTGTVPAHARHDPAARYDTFLLYGNNLGLLGGAERAGTLLDALTALAGPGARIVGQGSAGHLDARHPADLRYQRRNLAAGHLPGRQRVRVRHAGLRTGWYDWLFCTVDELCGVVADTGWRVSEHVPGERGRYLVVLDRT